MIETTGLGKRFGDFWAVDGVSLRVDNGQILALLGQNGAGKTTTVRMLSALLVPTTGSARVAGYDVVHQHAEVRALVGVLTEQHGLYVRMTAIEYLDFFGRLHHLGESQRIARIAYLLDYFGLAAASSRRIGEYSKGMRQKLALARALIHEPPVLLLDEPTSAMDPESARLVRDEIARLRSDDRTIVICTHNLAEAESLADTVAIIYRGQLLVQGTLDELRRTVLGVPEYEARFSVAWNTRGLELPGGVRLTQRTDSALRFSVEDPGTANPKLMHDLASMRAPLVSFQEIPRSLEAVYLQVMAQAQARQGAGIRV
ncbi:MAG TPA: ABC transporter ATP-binding protein [Anaerolineales bacterium]